MDEHGELSMPASPHPHYYVVRPDKTFVPLIAVDEINPMVRITGVPSSLTADIIEEWNMARCGDQVARHKQYYHLEFTTQAETKPTQVESSFLQGRNQSSQSGPARESSMEKSNLFSDKTAMGSGNDTADNRAGYVDSNAGHVDGGQDLSQASAGQKETQDTIEHLVKENKWAKENHPSRTKNAATPGVFGKKKFCTYWIRTGNCDYIQEGCKYLHVIPDEETRLSIGIRDMPRWAREELPTSRANFHGGQEYRPTMNQDWRRPVPKVAKAEIPEPARSYQPLAFPSANHQRTSGAAAWANQQSRNVALQNNDFQPPFLTSYSPSHQYLPAPAARMAQQTPRLHSVEPAAAEAYQHQMQGNTATYPATYQATPIVSTPTSAARRYSPPTQPPISRPTPNNRYTAPDKMPQGIQDQPQSALGSTETSKYTILSRPTEENESINSQDNVTDSASLEIDNSGMSTDSFLQPPSGMPMNESGRAQNENVMQGYSMTGYPSTGQQISGHPMNETGGYQVRPPPASLLTELPPASPTYQGTYLPKFASKFGSQDIRHHPPNPSRKGTPGSQSSFATATRTNSRPGRKNTAKANKAPDPTRPMVHSNRGTPNPTTTSSPPATHTPEPIMHRRQFVGPGESLFISNVPDFSRPPPDRSSTTRPGSNGKGPGKGKGRGRGMGELGKAPE